MNTCRYPGVKKTNLTVQFATYFVVDPFIMKELSSLQLIVAILL